MPTVVQTIYGGVAPPQGVPINLIETELGICVQGSHLFNSLPSPDLFSAHRLVLAKTTDRGLVKTKKDPKTGKLSWVKVEL